MNSRHLCLLTTAVIYLGLGQVRGQEGPPGSRPPAAPGTAPVSAAEKKYVDLSHSKDRVIKATAERYLNLVKFQEWGGASGKSQMAKYVSHDPDLKRVKLSVARGSGKDRVVKEFDVEVDKLNKICQARVKQIDVLQKRLDELAAAAAAKGDGTVGPLGPEGPHAPPGSPPPAGQPPAGPETAGPDAAALHLAAPDADPSASDPDPLGFAELPPVAPPAAGAAPPGAIGIPPSDPAATAAPAPGKPGSSADRKQWKNNFASFAANITVGADPMGKPMVDWGELRELKEMHDIVVAQRSPDAPARSPEAETPAAISERLGDVHWQVVVDKVEEGPGGLVIPTFHPVELTKPLEMRFVVDETDDLQKWAKLPPGATVNVAGRLTISEPYKITAKVKLEGIK